MLCLSGGDPNLRKFLILRVSSLALALAALVAPVSESHATMVSPHGACGSHKEVFFKKIWVYERVEYIKIVKLVPNACTRSHNHTGQWAVGCGIAAAGAEMIGAAVHASDKKDPRQSTIFEAGWYASACPVFLPWSLLVSVTCPDNKATYEVARQAHRYGKKTGIYNLAVFTDAYGPACRTGKLAPEFLAFLKTNHMPLSSFYLRG